MSEKNTLPSQTLKAAPGGNAQKLPRDYQVSKVYYAEKMAQHLHLGDYWVTTLSEDEVIDLVNQALEHPAVVARWGHKTSVSIRFNKRGHGAYAINYGASGFINLAKGTSNPFTVLHEVAHLLAAKKTEAAHGAGFTAIYTFLVTHVLGEDAGRILAASFSSLTVDVDETKIPPVRARGTRAGRNAQVATIPGLSAGQAASAAHVLRLIRDAGILDDDNDLRKAATRIARRLATVEKNVPAHRQAPLALPETITIPTGALLGADSRHDVAEIVLSAARNQIAPKKTKALPWTSVHGISA